MTKTDDPAAPAADEIQKRMDDAIAKAVATVTAEFDAKLAKAATDHAEELAKVAAERDELAKGAVALVTKVEALEKRASVIKAAGSGDKGTDGEFEKADDGLPANASPEERARHEIKKAHRSGGVPLITR